MSSIVAESCPQWCATDHSLDPGPVTVHNGQPQSFGECTIAFDDGAPAPVVMFPTSSTSPDGGEIRRGMVLNGRFLDVASSRAFVAALGRSDA